jgi:hypothetical protein
MTSFPAVINLSSLDGGNGFQINGETSFDLAGSSVSSAGDTTGTGSRTSSLAHGALEFLQEPLPQ